MKCTGKPLEILARLNEMAGYDPEEDIALYEVCLYCLLLLSCNLMKLLDTTLLEK